MWITGVFRNAGAVTVTRTMGTTQDKSFPFRLYWAWRHDYNTMQFHTEHCLIWLPRISPDYRWSRTAHRPVTSLRKCEAAHERHSSCNWLGGLLIQYVNYNRTAKSALVTATSMNTIVFWGVTMKTCWLQTPCRIPESWICWLRLRMGGAWLYSPPTHWPSSLVTYP
jgi:hypothetical protein